MGKIFEATLAHPDNEGNGEVLITIIDRAPERTALIITASYAHPDQKDVSLPGTKADGHRVKSYLEAKDFKVTWMKDFKVDEIKPDSEQVKDKVVYDEAGKLNDSDLYPSANNIRTKIQAFVKDARLGDTLWFQYSGHGSQIADDNGDEANSDGKDEVMVSADFKHPGSAATGSEQYIRDDFLDAEFSDKLDAGVKAFVMFDCCHSGTMFDMDYEWKTTPFTSDPKTQIHPCWVDNREQVMPQDKRMGGDD